MSKGTVELGEFERRESRHEMSQLTLEHQGEEIAADRAGAWQAVFWSQDDFGRESEDFPINWGTDHSRHVFVFGDKSSGDYDVKTRLRATLGDALAGAVDFPSPHERACPAITARAWRARRLRCLRNTAPSLASRACLRTLSAYWRSAVRTSAARLRRRDDVSVSASRSFEVASSIAIVFIVWIISALLYRAQGFSSVPLANIEGNQLVSCFITSSTASAFRFRHSRAGGNAGEGQRPSYRRRPVSRADGDRTWITAFAGMTEKTPLFFSTDI